MDAVVIIFGIVLPILILIGGAVAFYFLYWLPRNKSKKNKAGSGHGGYRFNYTVNHGDFINQLRSADSETNKENVKEEN